MAQPSLAPFVPLVSCEHASAFVPPAYAALFATDQAVLATHRAWDPGALDLARAWAGRWNAPLFAGEATRLICDLNRSPGNPSVWSAWTRPLPREEREAALTRWYGPYRAAIARAVAGAGGPVLHLAAHSFTPVWKGEERRVDIGLLYDPARPTEKRLALAWQAALRRCLPGLRIRRNTPYRGVADSLPGWFRARYADRDYAACEIECNQKLLEAGALPALAMAEALETCIREVTA